MTTLGEPPVWTEQEAQPYVRGSKPLEPGRARRLEEILDAFDRSQQTAVTRIAALTDEDLQRKTDGGTGTATNVGSWIETLGFHEAYHVGQVGLLRRLLGKEGAIA